MTLTDGLGEGGIDRMRFGWRRLWCAALAAASIVWAVSEARSANPTSQGELTIHVWKARHEMWLQDGDRIMRKFQVALGKNPASSKLQRGDGRTPEGKYYVCEKREHSRFHRFLGISYPNVLDAEQAFAERLITADQWADILFANLTQTVPPWETAMGGRVGIHGYGGRPLLPIDWTEGCIAVSDPDIDYLYGHVQLGTPVIISD
jgi:murein L,D-transpeptidase YafK